MRVTHFGHSCLLVEHLGARVLFDPGNFSHGFEGITGLDAIAITHQHLDHADRSRLPALMEANPGARLVADPQTTALLGEPWISLRPGETVSLGASGVQLTGEGGVHAVIHPEIPLVDNTAFLLGTAEEPAAFYHPGDSLYVPDQQVAVLATPAAAPWMKLSEAVDFLRAVAPRIAVPIHEAVVAQDARGIYFNRLSDMSAATTEFVVLTAEDAKELG